MKIAVAYFQHETNTFSPVVTRLSDFELIIGCGMLDKLSCRSIFLKAGAQLVPTIYASALPSGAIEKDSFIKLQNMIVDKLDQQLDGLLLHLHGAMEVEGLGSGEAALLDVIRQKTGPDLPIAVVLDFHANNSDWISRFANIICGYRTAPHVDCAEQEIKAAHLLLRCIETKIRPVSLLLRVPVVSNGDVATTSLEPMQGLMRQVVEEEQAPGIWTASIFNGQPWADVAGAGNSVVVCCTDVVAGLACARHLAASLWRIREAYQFPDPILPPDEAVDRAVSIAQGPVFIADTGDNVTGGAAGDSAGMLRLLLEKHIKDALLGGITDSVAVEACRNLSPGERIRLNLGGSLDSRSTKIVIEAQVKTHGTVPFWRDDGCCDCVVVQVSGIDLVITQKRCAFTSPDSFRRLGVSVGDYQIVVVKLGYLFPDLQREAKRVFMALTDGATCEKITRLGFHRIPRPMYPFDRDFSWRPADDPANPGKGEPI